MAKTNIIKSVISNPLVQTFLIYVSGGWIALEITDYIIHNYGLSERVRDVLSIILLVGLPLVIFLAWYLNRDKSVEDQVGPEDAMQGSPTKKEAQVGMKSIPTKRSRIIYAGILILIAISVTLVFRIRHQSKILWARGEAISEIQRLIIEEEYVKAYHLAIQAEKYISKDSVLINLWSRFSQYVTIQSEPSDAKVYRRIYSDFEEEWEYLGETPLDSLRFPFDWFRIKVEKEGFNPIQTGRYSSTMLFKLNREKDSLLNMVYVPGEEYELYMPGLEHLGPVQLEDYLVDKNEVTNIQYKEFIKNGGYKDPAYWRYKFIKEGDTLSFEEAMAEFCDATGQPGPSAWKLGDYPNEMDNYPVNGISWYEAAAYAEFADKSLPTLYHWNVAAGPRWGSEIIPLSNFNGKGPLPVGSNSAMSPFGSFDMAGNVREWCMNESGDQRIILGGGWDDPVYMFNDAYAQLPFDRSETNGFRCVKYLEPADNQSYLEEPIAFPFRDFLNEPKITDEVFEMYVKQYTYDKTALNAVVESVKEEEDYIREKIVFDAAYGNERMAAYLFLPKIGSPPYQVVVYFPGSNAMHYHSSENLTGSNVCIKSSRAFLYPIYKSTYEREDELKSDYPDKTIFYKDHVIMWVKDFSRSIDYLETREDINTDKLAYYGSSWGGAMGAIIPAVEPRIKASVLIVAGLNFQPALQEVDQVHYLPRITTPVLMLNGKYDFFFPYETSQLPFFELLGTKNEDKKIFVYEDGHNVPLTEAAKEMFAWLDLYLGPVSR